MNMTDELKAKLQEILKPWTAEMTDDIILNISAAYAEAGGVIVPKETADIWKENDHMLGLDEESDRPPQSSDELDEILSPFFKENLPWQEKLYGELYTAIRAYTQRQVLQARKKSWQAIRDIHMAHDWNDMSEDTKEWLKTELSSIQHMEAALTQQLNDITEGEKHE